MPQQATVAERAFQLAASGDFATVSEVKKRLKIEGYDGVEAHIQGSSLLGQLRKLCAKR
jgi:hypothetical protein